MKLFNFGYEKDSGLLFQFLVFTSTCTKQLLGFYKLETEPVHIKNHNTEAT